MDRNETFTALRKAYDDLIETCTKISQYRWADISDVKTLKLNINELEARSVQAQEVISGTRCSHPHPALQ